MLFEGLKPINFKKLTIALPTRKETPLEAFLGYKFNPTIQKIKSYGDCLRFRARGAKTVTVSEVSWESRLSSIVQECSLNEYAGIDEFVEVSDITMCSKLCIR